MNEIERAIAEIVGTNYGEVQCHRETILLAVNALREKAEREKGCEYCDDNFKFWQTQISGELPNVRYCPMCGKRLEVEHAEQTTG
jgi:hypothetical protein